MKKGATLVELIVTTLIISIISAVTAGIVISLLQLFVYLPREMKAKTIAHEIMDIISEGEPQKRGARYSAVIQDASPAQLTYTFGYPGDIDRRNIRLRWDSASVKIYRSYTAFGGSAYGPEELIPYYASSEISISGKPASPNTIFTYFRLLPNGAEEEFLPRNDNERKQVRRVEINIVVRTGTGLFSTWDSSFQTTSSVEIKQYI